MNAEYAEVLGPVINRAFHTREFVDDLAGKLGSKVVEQRDSRGNKIGHQIMMHKLWPPRNPPQLDRTSGTSDGARHIV